MECMMNYLGNILRRNRLIQIYIRRRRALSLYENKLKLAREWSRKRTEFSNYYYQLTPRNREDLAFLISVMAGIRVEQVEDLFNEVENNQNLKETLMNFKNSRKDLCDSTMELGRRIGWYALIRIARPRLVVETGVHHGLGSLVICAALLKNREEGFMGRYLGVDIDPNCGSLFQSPFTEVGSIVTGDSLELLPAVESEIDFFINDSDHSAHHEMSEYLCIKDKLNDGSIILGDNCHQSDSLRFYSRSNNRNFIFFKEEPYNHFYTGAGIGISFLKIGRP